MLTLSALAPPPFRAPRSGEDGKHGMRGPRSPLPSGSGFFIVYTPVGSSIGGYFGLFVFFAEVVPTNCTSVEALPACSSA